MAAKKSRGSARFHGSRVGGGVPPAVPCPKPCGHDSRNTASSISSGFPTSSGGLPFFTQRASPRNASARSTTRGSPFHEVVGGRFAFLVRLPCESAPTRFHSSTDPLRSLGASFCLALSLTLHDLPTPRRVRSWIPAEGSKGHPWRGWTGPIAGSSTPMSQLPSHDELDDGCCRIRLGL